MIGPIKGTLKPIHDHVLVTDMYFGDQKTKSGIIILNDDGKSEGIRPRWCKVWAVGSEQEDVSVGDWILVEHGRWTRGVQLENDDGTTFDIRRVDTEGIIAISDSKPDGVEFGTLATGTPGESYEFKSLQQVF
jgi:co-chaperonin GroES (HSP10)